MDDMEDMPLEIKSCGDGLWFSGGDIHCAYPLISVTVNADNVVYEYEPYTITVSWTNQDGKRSNPKWKRTYKDGRE